MTSVHVQKVHPAALLPQRSHTGDLGYDLFAVEDATIAGGARVAVATGIQCQFPEGWGAYIKDRSSMASKGLHALAGVIDQGYRGEIKVLLANLGQEPYSIRAGDKIAQLVPTPVTDWNFEPVDQFETESSRGEGGFGSTGR